MIPIKLDKINIALLLVAGLVIVISLILPALAGIAFSITIAIIAIAFIRTVYLKSGLDAALIAIIFILLIPLGMYIFYLTLKK